MDLLAKTGRSSPPRLGMPHGREEAHDGPACYLGISSHGVVG